MTKLIIGLDISSVCIGYTILDDKGNIIKIDYEKFPKVEMLEKGLYLEKFINKLLLKHPDLTSMFVEAKLNSFRSGGTNMQSMLKLFQINFLTQFLFTKKNVSVTEINVTTARNLCFPGFIKTANITNIKHKDLIYKLVTNLIGDDLFPKKKIKSGRLTRAIQTASYNSDHFIISNMLAIPCTDQPLAIL